MLRGSDKVAGIDLGTTNSCVSIFKQGRIEVAVDSLGAHTTPSMVSFNEGSLLYGRNAKNQMIRNYKNTIYDVKRLIGHSFDEEGVQSDIKRWPFLVTKDSNNRPVINITYHNEVKTYRPEEISSFVIKELVKIAQTYGESEITDIVITVPAYFNNNQRQATIDAGRLAGYNVLEVLNEPTAAALAYGFENKGNKTILVYDLGGGTFDCTLLTVENKSYRVVGTDGDCHLGGDDFDAIMEQMLIEKIPQYSEEPLNLDDKRIIQKIRNLAETTKIELSQTTEVDIEPEFIDCEEFVITRQEFEERCADLFNRTKTIIEQLLNDIHYTTSMIDDVVLIGGSSRIPYVKQMLSDMFGSEHIYERIDPDEAVSKGAVIEAGRLMNKKLQEEEEDLCMSRIPSGPTVFVDNGDDDNDSDYSYSDDGGDDNGDDDGYAQIAMIADIVIKQVIPLSIGVKNSEKMLSKILLKNTPYGSSSTRTYVTSRDNMTSMKIHVYQGERPLATDNYELGVVKVTGITKMPKGEASIDLTLSIDDNGILSLQALDNTTGKITTHEFENKLNLSEEEIKRMQEEADLMREEDALRVKRQEKKNTIDSYRHDIESIIRNGEVTLTEENQNELLQFLAEVKSVLKSSDVSSDSLDECIEACKDWKQVLTA